MANRAVLIVDAKADKALKELDKLKRKMEQTGQPAQRINRSFDGLAGKIGAIAGPAAVVGTVFQGWRQELAQAEEAVKRMTKDLRDAAIGAGQIQDIQRIRQFFSSADAFSTQEGSRQQYAAFMAADPSASFDTARTVVTALDPATATNPSGIGAMGGIAGALTQFGMDPGLAGNYAIGLSQAAGGRANNLATNLPRILMPMAGSGVDPDQLVALSLAITKGGDRVSSALPLISAMVQSDPGAIASFLNDPQGQTLPGLRPETLASLRNTLPAALDEVRGFGSSRANLLTGLTANRQDRLNLAQMATSRETQNAQTSTERVEGQLVGDLAIAQRELEIEQMPGLQRLISRGAFWLTGGNERRLIEDTRETLGVPGAGTEGSVWVQINETTQAQTRVLERMANRPPIPNANEGMQ